MRATEQELVRRIAARSDSEAFAVVVNRYADMVYTTCWRILQDEQRAADVAQETFFQLFKSAGRIRGCLAAWLHRVATGRAIDMVRQESSRRRRELAYTQERGDGSSTWAQVEPLVDEALERLAPDLHEVLVLHFLEQKKMHQIAADKGISQPTVSRRVAEALERVRADLRDKGVLIGIAGLQTFLVQSMQWAPETLLRKLGKMALTHAASSAGGATSAAVVGAASRWALAAGTAVLLIMGGWKWLANEAQVETSQPLPPVQMPERAETAQDATANSAPLPGTAPAPQAPARELPVRPMPPVKKAYVAQARPIPLVPLTNAPLRLAPLAPALPILLTNIELAGDPAGTTGANTNPLPELPEAFYSFTTQERRWVGADGMRFPVYGTPAVVGGSQVPGMAPYKLGNNGRYVSAGGSLYRGGVLPGRRIQMVGGSTAGNAHEITK